MGMRAHISTTWILFHAHAPVDMTVDIYLLAELHTRANCQIYATHARKTSLSSCVRVCARACVSIRVEINVSNSFLFCLILKASFFIYLFNAFPRPFIRLLLIGQDFFMSTWMPLPQVSAPPIKIFLTCFPDPRYSLLLLTYRTLLVNYDFNWQYLCRAHTFYFSFCSFLFYFFLSVCSSLSICLPFFLFFPCLFFLPAGRLRLKLTFNTSIPFALCGISSITASLHPYHLFLLLYQWLPWTHAPAITSITIDVIIITVWTDRKIKKNRHKLKDYFFHNQDKWECCHDSYKYYCK